LPVSFPVQIIYRIVSEAIYDLRRENEMVMMLDLLPKGVTPGLVAIKWLLLRWWSACRQVNHLVI